MPPGRCDNGSCAIIGRYDGGIIAPPLFDDALDAEGNLNPDYPKEERPMSLKCGVVSGYIGTNAELAQTVSMSVSQYGSNFFNRCLPPNPQVLGIHNCVGGGQLGR